MYIYVLIDLTKNWVEENKLFLKTVRKEEKIDALEFHHLKKTIHNVIDVPTSIMEMKTEWKKTNVRN